MCMVTVYDSTGPDKCPNFALENIKVAKAEFPQTDYKTSKTIYCKALSKLSRRVEVHSAIHAQGLYLAWHILRWTNQES